MRAASTPVQRRLSKSIDPLDLYREISGGGERPDTALFEGADGLTLLMARAAVRAECVGDQVLLRALTTNGQALLDAVRSVRPDRLRSESTDMLEFRFPDPSSLEPDDRLVAPSPLHAIRSILAAAKPSHAEPFAALALGVVAFEHGAFGEKLPEQRDLGVPFPDYLFWIPDSLILFEPGAPPRLLCAAFGGTEQALAERNHHDAVARLQQLVEICEAVRPSPAAALEPVHSEFDVDLDDGHFADLVDRLKKDIAAGEVYQIVPSRTFRAPCPEPLRAYAALRGLETNGYRFFVRSEDFTLLGASPETSVRLFRDDGGWTVEVKPIAGTRPRGKSADEDDRLEAEMRLDGKELAEHMMLVDLARNDIARISLTGTRRVAKLLTVERYARVMHLVSSVQGRLAIGFDAFDALAACLNVGTLTGAPKLRATQILREVEATRRGPYGGAIGWINGAGAMDTAVIIRSALVRDGVAEVRAGAGIVQDSDPREEADETRRKASALLSILAVAECGVS